MRKWLFFLALNWMMSGSFAQEYASVQTLFDTSSVLNKHFYGFSLYDIDEGRFVFGVNEGKHFTPASNTKVFSLFTSLKHIGDSIPGLAYIIRGDSLLFWGTGDPTFLHKKLDSGKVYEFLASSPYKLFYVPVPQQEESYRPGWSVEDYQYYYQPDLSSFPIYGNTVGFESKSGKLTTSPSYFEHCIFINGKGGKFEIERRPHENVFELSTLSIPANYAADKPFIYSTDLFIELLQDTLKRTVESISYSMPSEVNYVYSVANRDVLREMMLVSDNFFAEQLGYISSFLKYGIFDSAKLRKSMQDDYYVQFSDKVNLRDESGLSSYNKVTPRSMVELLLMIRQIIPSEEQLYYFFPAGGVDGTLRNAYPLSKGKPFVWAKTGTINAVHCQSGFLTTQKGKRYVFSFLNNNFIGSTAEVRKEMVSVITHIHQKY